MAAKGDPDPGLFRQAAATQDSTRVECLGTTFESEEARREYFLARLKEKLPELRQRPDFPVAEDEDILRLSDPPYYTACPNPFLAEFVEHHGRPYDPDERYHREPFAVDVSAGKTDPLYRAHGYHTKVPHLAIVPSILHYTQPGDVVLDGFCGSGMTGVAAQWCGTAPPAYRRTLEQRWQADERNPPTWGARRVVLGDLSPAATFIAANYNIPFDVSVFSAAAAQILKEVAAELSWMYETTHSDRETRGRINYTVWSEMFSCPECFVEFPFIAEALDPKSGRIKSEFPCPECRAVLTKKKLNRLRVSEYDPEIDKTITTTKRIPVFINYTVNRKRYQKKLDSDDFHLLGRIDVLAHPIELPFDRMMHASDDIEAWGDEWRPGVAAFTHVHHVFLSRPAHALAALWRRARACPNLRIRNMLIYFVEQAVPGMSLLNRYSPLHFSQVNRHMAGRLRILSQHAECAPHYVLGGKLYRLVKAFSPLPSEHDTSVVTTGDCSRLAVADNSIDYIFTDPPFGHNLAYAELNFINEAFLRAFTNVRPEAIVNGTQEKDLSDYRRLMQQCFSEYRRVLKPGRWMTVVFHNSKNAVWNAIQEALLSAGFLVADVRLLDKKHGTFNQINSVNAVKQDLVISAYKPNGGLEDRFRLEAGTEDGAWDFVRSHLRRLPVFVGTDGRAEVIAERQSYLLFDRMVAFHVQRGVTVPLSAAEFHAGLRQRFPERDGMFFLREQVAEYDPRRLAARELVQLELFVRDEETAIQWLRQQLERKPQTFQEIHPHFIRELAGWLKHERMIDLSEFLAQNFLRYDGTGEVPSPIHAYLSTNFKELRNLPKARLRSPRQGQGPLVRPRSPQGHRPRRAPLPRPAPRVRRVPGLHATPPEGCSASKLVRAGFRRAWQAKDYPTIVEIARQDPRRCSSRRPQAADVVRPGLDALRTGVNHGPQRVSQLHHRRQVPGRAVPRPSAEPPFRPHLPRLFHQAAGRRCVEAPCRTAHPRLDGDPVSGGRLDVAQRTR